MENGGFPLLSTRGNQNSQISGNEDDSSMPNNGIQNFFREFYVESKRLWYIGTPAIITAICQYSLGAITQIFAGHLGTLELAAISVENSVIAGFAYGIMLGMGSALETQCGIAYGAGRLDMLGIYLQRSLVILNATALPLTSIYIFATPILKLLGQTSEISEAAGIFSLYMIPQLFAYAMNYPLVKFLQAQNRFMAMAVISSLALAFHVLFTWLLVVKLGWGLEGAALALNSSWWFIVLAQLFYVVCGACGRAWTGFSWMAFHSIWGIFKLSVASGLMFLLDTWYSLSVTLLAGYFTDAEVSVDASSICLNISGWSVMIGFGFSAAISVRVSNELGAVNARAVKYSAMVVGLTSFLLSLFLALILIITRNQYPSLFSTDTEVKKLLYELSPVLGITIVLKNAQYALNGVAIGAGWQAFVAYINLGCYYLFGIPLALLMGYRLDMGVEGIWWALACGTILQACILLCAILVTNWNKEASIAQDKLKDWGEETDYNEI